MSEHSQSQAAKDLAAEMAKLADELGHGRETSWPDLTRLAVEKLKQEPVPETERGAAP